MQILEIYQQYNILPFLQTHMLRVAAVADLICRNFDLPVDQQSITTTCLLHDMGNIIKFDLGLYPEQVSGEGQDYWEKIKAGYIERYGEDEHQATYAIARELKVRLKVRQLLEAMGFSKSEKNSKSSDHEVKICAYADNRVSPYGIVSLEERLADGRKRYEANRHRKSEQDYFDKMSSFSREIEKQVFTKCRITPEEITDAVAAPVISELQDFSI